MRQDMGSLFGKTVELRQIDGPEAVQNFPRRGVRVAIHDEAGNSRERSKSFRENRERVLHVMDDGFRVTIVLDDVYSTVVFAHIIFVGEGPLFLSRHFDKRTNHSFKGFELAGMYREDTQPINIFGHNFLPVCVQSSFGPASSAVERDRNKMSCATTAPS